MDVEYLEKINLDKKENLKLTELVKIYLELSKRYTELVAIENGTYYLTHIINEMKIIREMIDNHK